MEKDKKSKTEKTEVQTGEDIKKGLPIKTKSTDSAKNTAAQTPGLNEDKTTRDDLFPSDGDNMTS